MDRSTLKIAALGAVVIWLVSAIFIGSHGHADEKQHPDCSICVAGTLYASCHPEVGISGCIGPIWGYLGYIVLMDKPADSAFSIFASRAPPSPFIQ